MYHNQYLGYFSFKQCLLWLFCKSRYSYIITLLNDIRKGKIKRYSCHEGVWWNGSIDPHFLDFGTIWRWAVRFTPRYRLARSLGGPHSRSRRRGEKKFLTLQSHELRLLGRPARSQSLYRLRYPGSKWHTYSYKPTIPQCLTAGRAQSWFHNLKTDRLLRCSCNNFCFLWWHP
jgi:hypothetical protein